MNERKRRAESVYILANWPVAHSHPLWKDCGCCPHPLSSILYCQCIRRNIRMLILYWYYCIKSTLLCRIFWPRTAQEKMFHQPVWHFYVSFKHGLYACTDWDTVPGNIICEFVTPKMPQVTLFSSLTEHVEMWTWTPIQDLDHILVYSSYLILKHGLS